jgi:tight adherence protein B
MSTVLLGAFVVALLTFGIVMFVFRPSPDQKALDRRFDDLKSSSSGELGDPTEVKQILKVQHEGSFGWLEDVVDSSPFYRMLQLLLLQSDSKMNVGAVLASCLGVAIGVMAVTFVFTAMLAIAIPVGLLAGVLPFLVLRIRRNRRVSKFNRSLADCIDMMARSLRAGHSMIAAINIIAEQAPQPARYEFGEVYKKQNYGLPLRDSLMQMLDRVPSQDLRVFVTGLLVQKDTGGNLAEILDRIVFVIRERVRIQGEIRVHTAQGRMTGWILTALPFVLLVIINIVDPGYSDVLFRDPTGREMLYVGVVLLLVGGVIIRQIINGIEL